MVGQLKGRGQVDDWLKASGWSVVGKCEALNRSLGLLQAAFTLDRAWAHGPLRRGGPSRHHAGAVQGPRDPTFGGDS
jgi:hypothetical protein